MAAIRLEYVDTSTSYAGDCTDVQIFKEFADARDLALLLVHHARKRTDGENPSDQVSGSNGLPGAADGGFVLYGEGPSLSSSPSPERKAFL